MPRNADDIERSIMIPSRIAEPMLDFAKAQDAARGDWAGGRGTDQPEAPWPPQESPILRYLLYKFQESLASGMDAESAALQLAVHSWFEGGIENYDRGQRDARGL